MKNKKETKELFVVPEFNELPDDEKKKVVKLLGKKEFVIVGIKISKWRSSCNSCLL